MRTIKYHHYNERTFTLNISANHNYCGFSPLDKIPKKTKIIIFEQNSKFNDKVGHDGCNQNDCPQNLPSELIHLTFGNQFNQLVDNLPHSLTHLTFGYDFNQNVEKLPPNLTHLTFGFKFDKSVDNLPRSLTHLTFGCEFNQSVDYLPEILTNLSFGKNFNEHVNELPDTLTHLIFGRDFNKSLSKLPKNLTHLTVGKYFQKTIDNSAEKLIFMQISSNYNFVSDIPITVENIKIQFSFQEKFNKTINNLPVNIKEIIINKPNKKNLIKKIPFGCKILYKYKYEDDK